MSALEVCESETSFVYYTYIIPIVWGINALCIAYPAYLYITALRAKNLKSSPLMARLTTTFFTAQIIMNIGGIINNASFCHNNTVNVIFYGVEQYAYLTQAMLLCIILFMRLKEIFKETPALQVRRCPTVTFIFLCILMTIMGLFGIALIYYIPSMQEVGLQINVLGGLVYLIVISWLNGLFIYKLHIVYKKCAQNTKMVNIITKTWILALVSTSMLILTIIALQINGTAGTPHTYFIFVLALIVDINTNCMSVFLSFSHFRNYYDTVCGKCHDRCFKCCTNCIKVESVDHEMMQRQQAAHQAVPSASPSKLESASPPMDAESVSPDSAMDETTDLTTQ